MHIAGVGNAPDNSRFLTSMSSSFRVRCAWALSLCVNAVSGDVSTARGPSTKYHSRSSQMSSTINPNGARRLRPRAVSSRRPLYFDSTRRVPHGQGTSDRGAHACAHNHLIFALSIVFDTAPNLWACSIRAHVQDADQILRPAPEPLDLGSTLQNPNALPCSLERKQFYIFQVPSGPNARDLCIEW
ncbi:hypothetical protein B0H17DRAFT_1208390 [Mycena rosella]|uniref:Uncharacterized protein n=1 Tax=Mycena rosella TaxID=1033263 RepID=A0AAD7G767_MYCRO|nr:hypothetical protein B0H17DRAFT_1208390 [Mycena rosella]